MNTKEIMNNLILTIEGKEYKPRFFTEKPKMKMWRKTLELNQADITSEEGNKRATAFLLDNYDGLTSEMIEEHIECDEYLRIVQDLTVLIRIHVEGKLDLLPKA